MVLYTLLYAKLYLPCWILDSPRAKIMKIDPVDLLLTVLTPAAGHVGILSTQALS